MVGCLTRLGKCFEQVTVDGRDRRIGFQNPGMSQVPGRLQEDPRIRLGLGAALLDRHQAVELVVQDYAGLREPAYQSLRVVAVEIVTVTSFQAADDFDKFVSELRPQAAPDE